MNARGSTEVIVVTIGLSVGVLSQNLFTVIVAMAIFTTMAMPPMLRWALVRLPMSADERARLEREEFEQKGFCRMSKDFCWPSTKEGYDMMVIGRGQVIAPSGGFHDDVRQVAAGFDGPSPLVVTRGEHLERPTGSDLFARRVPKPAILS